MLHFSCDLCGQELGDERFVVKLEVFPAFDPDELTEEDLDPDNLAAVAEMIQEMEATGQALTDDVSAKKLRFDLCPHCRRKFLRDPLGRDAFRRLYFSEN